MNGLLKKVVAGVVVAGVIVLGGAPATEAQAAAAIVVNDGGDDCGGLAAGHASMQAAVDAAIASSTKTILVCPGGYFPFVVDGANKLTIKAAKPSLLMPMIGPEVASSGTLVTIRNSRSVVIDGLRVDGTNFEDTLTGETVGIRITDSTVTIQNSVVASLHDVPTTIISQGSGIIMKDTNAADSMKSAITLKNNKIVEIARIRVEISGAVKAVITGNEISGTSDYTDHQWYGIILAGSPAGSPTGSVTNNVIHDIGYAIAMGSTNKMVVKANTISGTNQGISMSSSCSGRDGTANSNVIMSNHISAAKGFYISLDSSGCVSHVDKNTISKNTFVFADPSGWPTPRNAAIVIYAEINEFNSIRGNKITGNTFVGWDEMLNASGDTGTVFKGNKMVAAP